VHERQLASLCSTFAARRRGSCRALLITSPAGTLASIGTISTGGG
jgi:hypothetical protein